MTALKVAATSAINAVVKANADLPELQAELTAIDPRLAASMATKVLLASRTPWVVMGAPLLSAALAHYGFGVVDVPTVSSIMAVTTLLASYVMRYISTAYISGFVKMPGTTVAAATAPPATPPIAPVVIAP